MSVDFQKILMNTSEKEFDLVLKEFKVTEGDMEDELIRIKNWMKIQPHLSSVKIDENVLKRFLLCNAFNAEKVKTKLDNMYTARATIPEYFTKRDITIPGMRSSMYINNWCILPQKTPDNYRIIFMSEMKSDPDSFDPMSWIKVGFMIGDLRMRYETSTGDHYIFDCTNMTLGHASKWIPHMKKQTYVLQNCYSAIIKGVHILNCPSYMFNMITLLKSMLKKKIADRIHVHKTLEDFYQYIPKEMLPSDLGGEQKSRKEITDEWYKAMSSKELQEWFTRDEKQKSNESRRIKPSDLDQFKEMQGTFRTLCID